LSASRNPDRLAGRILCRPLALLLHQDDKTGPVENGGAGPQMGLEIVLVTPYFPPATSAVSLVHGVTPYIEVLFSSSNELAENSRLAALPQSSPSQ
jgi:hypothetical protein